MLRAALLMIVGMSLVPLGDAAGKLLGSAHGVEPVFIAWSRFVIGALLLVPFLAPRHYDLRVFLDWRVLLRGLLIVGGITSILTALRTEPLPNVFGAFFVGPLLSFALSVWLLGEKATPLRVLFLILGFCGVLLVVKPGFGMTPGLGFAVLAGIFYGSFLTASRWLANTALPRTLLLSQLVVGAVVLTPFGPAAAPAFTPAIGGLVLLSAGASMAANLLLIMAYKLVPATRLAPLVYFQLVAATAFGWLIFGNLPDALTLAGLALLVGSGLGSLALRH